MEKRNYNGIEYELTRKSVKNINLRVANGVVKVSAHPRVALHLIEGLIAKHEPMIRKALAKKVIAKDYTLYGEVIEGDWSTKDPKIWDAYLAKAGLKELRQINRQVYEDRKSVV